MRSSRRPAVLAAAICTAVTLGMAASAEAKLSYYDLFEWGVGDHAQDATSVRICWGGDGAWRSDSWRIRRASGATPPPADAPPVATLPGGTEGACYTATGLVTDAPYTFRITGHDASGESEPGFITAAARNEGTFVLDGARGEELAGGSNSKFGEARVAVTPRDRRWHAVYYASSPGTVGLMYTSRAKSGWTKPVRVGNLNSLPLLLAANPGGALAAGWSPDFEFPHYRLKPPGASAFGARRPVPHPKGATPSSFGADALALDRRGRVHLLLEDDGGGLRYAANASGKWRDQAIPNTRCAFFIFGPCTRRPFLTYDAAADRVVVVEQQRPHGLRIATKRASAKKLGAFHALAAANKRHLIATGLTAWGGRITLGLESNVGDFPIESAAGPLYVMTGGRLVRVPGTTADDWNLLVAASSRDRVQLAWQRRSTSWDRSQQGIWTAESVRNKRTGRWSIRNIRHRTVSHYDLLTSLTVTATGRALIAHLR